MNSEDIAAAAALRRSRIYAWADRGRALLVNAVSHSRVASGWRRIETQQAGSSWAERRAAGGTVLLVASIWHIVLLTTAGEYASRLAFVLPAIAGLIGALAIVSASSVVTRR